MNMLVALLFSALLTMSSGQDIRTQPAGGIFSNLFPNFLLPATPCLGQNDFRSGTCRTSEDCLSSGGVADGQCLTASQVCCLPVVKCGATVLNNNSALANPDYPRATDGTQVCNVVVRKAHVFANTFILHLDTFELAQPDSRGRCVQDKLEVEGMAEGNSVLPLCGENNNQHLVVPLRQGADSITIRVVTSGNGARKWLIRVVQLIDTNTASMPRIGCSQYYSGSLEGKINSFNFNSETNTGLGSLDNTRYSICFRKEAAFCRIQFNATYFDLAPKEGGSLVLNREERQADEDIPETNEAGNMTTTEATHSAIVPFLPFNQTIGCNGQDSLTFPPAQERKAKLINCGHRFNNGSALVLDLEPFVIYVESGRSHGRGFALNYKYLIC